MKIYNIQKSINDSSCDHEYIYVLLGNFIEYNRGLIDISIDEEIEYFKIPVLLTIKILLERNIIQVHDPINGGIWTCSPKESINKIKHYWKKNSTYPDFYDMPSFSWTEEFKNKILNDGYVLNTNWESYLSKSPWLKKLLKVDENIFMDRLQEVM